MLVDEAFILTPLFPPAAHAAPLTGAEDLFLTGTHWTRMFRQAGHTPPHQRFARRDENVLVGEPVWGKALIVWYGVAMKRRLKTIER